MRHRFQGSRLYLSIIRVIIRKFRQYSTIPIKYKYNNFSIMMPAFHLLPEYKKMYPKYDRFLPFLAKYIVQSETIVDIGANVGDTLAGMVEKNTSSSYVCIEPDDLFFSYLQYNVKRIRNSITNVKIRTINALIGNHNSKVSLRGKGGTKHAVIEVDGSIRSVTLDELTKREMNDINIRLLKSDVDGFDYDVINSATSVIKKYKPIIYFECQYEYEYQKIGYEKTLKSLESFGYCDWTIFDNFGEIIVRTDSVMIISQLLSYVWKQNTGQATRTIYYFDILAVQQADSKLIDGVLEEYI